MSIGTALHERTAALNRDLRDIADVRREMATKAELAEMKAELIKWVVGVGFAQVAMILAVLKLFPTGHP